MPLNFLNTGYFADKVGIGTNSPNAKLEINSSLTSFPSAYPANDNISIKVTDINTSYAADAGGSIMFSGIYDTGGSILGQGPYIKGSKANATSGDYGFGLRLGVRASGSSNSNVAMSITDDSNVGIGITNPIGARLVVANGGSDPQIMIKNTAGNNAIILLEDNSGATQNASITFNQAGQNTLTIATGFQSPTDLNKINIAPAGNVGLTVRGGNGGSGLGQPLVGIGTSTPQKKLHIEGPGGASASQLLVTGADDTIGSTAGILLRAEAGEGDSALRAKGGIFFERTAANGLGKLHFANNGSNNNDSAVLANARMTILNNGNIGIGTTTPLAKFDVQGTQGQLFSVTDDLSGEIFAVADISGVPIFKINSSGLSTFTGLVSGITPVNPANFVTKAYVDGPGGGTGPFLPLAGGTLTGALGIGVTAGSNAKLEVVSTTGEIFRADAASGAFRIIADQTGVNTQGVLAHTGTATFSSNVGIGTTSAAAAPLDVHFADNASPQRWSYAPAPASYFLDLHTNIPTGGVVQYLFNMRTNGITYNNTLVLDRGNVGVGTSTLSEKFEVNGNIKIKDALLSNQINTDIDTGTEVVGQVVKATYTAAFFDFVIKKGTNVRSGTVYACHDGSTGVEFTETSTQDLGDTSDVTLSVDLGSTTMRLLATTTSDDWSVKSLIRAI